MIGVDIFYNVYGGYMKKALFVHGFNSDENSSTGKKVKKVLGELGFDTTLKTFDVLSPFKTKAEIEELLNTGVFDLVVGHSLGGFYVFVANTQVKKILINPCLEPEKDLKKASGVVQKTLDEFAVLNKENVSLLQRSEARNIFSLFGVHDEVISYIDLFAKYYSDNYILLECTHRPDESSLIMGFKGAFAYMKEKVDVD